MNIQFRLSMSLIAMYVAGTCVADAQTYRVTAIGKLAQNGEYITGAALNSSNQVVGYTLPGSLYVVPVLWQNGTASDLGGLNGSGNYAQAYGINAAGEIVGSSASCPGCLGPLVAVKWVGGSITSLGTLDGNASDATSTAYAINASGQITGTTSIPAVAGNPAIQAPFLYSGGVMSNLDPTSTLNGTPTAINDGGDVVGYRSSPLAGGPPGQAVLWSGGTTTLLPQLPGAVASASSQATGINNQRQIVGLAFPGGESVSSAVVWTIVSGTPTVTALNVPSGPAEALGINNVGQIVGSSSSGAMLWSSVGATGVDLNTLIDPATPLPLALSQAVAINDNGVILALAVQDAGDDYQSFLLVPEPVSLSVTPTTLSFPAQKVGTTSVSQTVTVKNTGTVALNFNPLQLSGDFSQTSTCGTSLEVGASCTIQVKFTPTAPGARSGTFNVGSGGTVDTVSLAGTGTISVTLTASATSSLVNEAVTLNWNAPGTSCTASGGSASDGWSGTLTASGSKPVTESTTGKYTYGISCTGGGQTGTAQVVVNVGLPTVTLAAAPTTVTAGQATKLTWTSTFATTCTASGGNAGDGWSGTEPTAGSASVTEAAAGTYTYTLTCTSGANTGQGVAVVTVSAPASSGGGGGALDTVTLLSLLTFVAYRIRYRRGLDESLISDDSTANSGYSKRPLRLEDSSLTDRGRSPSSAFGRPSSPIAYRTL